MRTCIYGCMHLYLCALNKTGRLHVTHMYVYIYIYIYKLSRWTGHTPSSPSGPTRFFFFFSHQRPARPRVPNGDVSVHTNFPSVVSGST